MSQSLQSIMLRGGGDDAIVTAVGVENGIPFADVLQLYDAVWHRRCPIIHWGGWGGQSFNAIRIPPGPFDPEKIGQYPTALVIYRSGSQTPVVVGLTNPGAGKGAMTGESQEDTDTKDTAVTDSGWNNGGSYLGLKDGTGNILASPKNDMLVALRSGQALRLSVAGDDDGRVALVDPLLSYLVELTATVQQLATWASALVTVPLPTVPITYGPVVRFLGSAPTPPAPGDISAGALHVPSNPEGT